MDTCTNSRTLQRNEHFKELMKHVTNLPVRSACKPCCREACFCKSVTEFMSVLHGQNIAKAIPQIPLCPTKPSYNPNSLDFELCWESLQQHRVQEPEAPCIHSPAVLQQSHGLKLGGGFKAQQMSGGSTASDHPHISPRHRSRCMEKILQGTNAMLTTWLWQQVLSNAETSRGPKLVWKQFCCQFCHQFRATSNHSKTGNFSSCIS